MMRFVFWLSLLALCTARSSPAQEASSGVDVHATVTAQAFASNVLTGPARYGSPVTGGYRAVVYPTIKLDEHFVISAALQSVSRPYFHDNLDDPGYGIRDSILQATLGYARVSERGSVLVRAGVLSTAFGSFPLRYDDTDNPLTQPPLQYGYYYDPVTTLGVLGAQVDATRGRWDGRLQAANSSPVNPRSVFAKDQYLNWAGGAGYTVRQGLRIGVSAYRGPFLSRDYDYFFPGEANPNTLPARAGGVDVQWAHGHWNLQGEWQTFVFPYRAIPTFREQAGYVEAKRVLTPRWYVAARGGYTHSKLADTAANYEFVGGFRTNRFQTMKFSYGLYTQNSGGTTYDHMGVIQLVTSLRIFSRSRQ